MPGVFDWLQQALGGSTEGTGTGYASSQPSPDLLQYAQDVLSGRMAASGPIGQARYDPAKSFGQNVMDPAAHEAAMSMVGPAAIRAYHASPFDFAKFSLENLRGGTGGLAQGRGLYFAQREPVSLDYKRQFQERGGAFEGPDPTGPYMDAYNAASRAIETPVNMTGRATDIAASVAEGVRRGDDLAHYRNFVKQSDWDPEKKAMWIAAIDAAMPYKFKPGPAHMYEVDIHTDPNRLLNWDRPMSAQSPEVMQALGNTEHLYHAERQYGSNWGDRLTGEDFYKNIVGDDPASAARLVEAGIPGNKYLDQFSRNLSDKAVGGRSYNYVISDPERTRIEILRKYGILPPLAVGAGGGLLGPADE